MILVLGASSVKVFKHDNVLVRDFHRQCAANRKLFYLLVDLLAVVPRLHGKRDTALCPDGRARRAMTGASCCPSGATAWRRRLSLRCCDSVLCVPWRLVRELRDNHLVHHRFVDLPLPNTSLLRFIFPASVPSFLYTDTLGIRFTSFSLRVLLDRLGDGKQPALGTRNRALNEQDVLVLHRHRRLRCSAR